MSGSNPAQQFLTAENEAGRLASMDVLASAKLTSEMSSAVWQITNQFLTRSEKSRFAHSLRLGSRPGSSWALCSNLMRENDQDVVGNAINALTLSKNRSLGHRILKFFDAQERPQRILYCIARYAEEAVDRRFAKFLAPNLAGELSDAFLARSFNAMYRLGVHDKYAVQVANELVASHIDATNMDRKAAVSATLYLFFGAPRAELEKLHKVQEKMGIPELRRLLNWGYSQLDAIGSNGFNAADATSFFKRALVEAEPNFTGYGCFEEAALLDGLSLLINGNAQPDAAALVRTVLALGEPGCINMIANHPRYGIRKAMADKDESTVSQWRKYLPLHSSGFLETLSDPDVCRAWQKDDPEMLFTLFTSVDLPKAQVQLWQKHFENDLKNDPQHALDYVCAQLLSLEGAAKRDAKQHHEMQENAFKNLNLVKDTFLRKSKSVADRAALEECIYGLCLSGDFSTPFFDRLLSTLPLICGSWASIGVAGSVGLEMDAWNKNFSVQLEEASAALQNPQTLTPQFPENVACLQNAVLAGLEGRKSVLQPTLLDKLDDISKRVQQILSAANQLTQPSTTREEDEGETEGEGDWNGHVSVDAPILRWNAIIQVLSRQNLTPAQITEFETVLIEGMRLAPHVEKRWIVRALARLSTDNSIKAILYQAFQHVDGDFVVHTIRELLPSRHPRAQQALIRCIGRNTISDDLKLTILDELSMDNPQDILQELKTLEILRLPQHIDDAIRDAVGRVSALVSQDEAATPIDNKATTADVDANMRQMLPDVDQLSVDSRSALRTAEMILIQSRDWGAEAVDLSPIVNMHFKAVELTMRECFEAYTDAAIRKGMLSRKLDIVGYARPIPEKMQVFEDFLANLPVIRTVPYFSKFKLRKMLRAVCLYRPGKRFTLDGPKAFALFFLVASRRQCPYGLEHLFDLDFKTDAELFEFIKLVHSLQDSRNRAVHEGLTWDAKDEIESMRRQAYKIIEQCLKLGRNLQKTSGQISVPPQTAANTRFGS